MLMSSENVQYCWWISQPCQNYIRWPEAKSVFLIGGIGIRLELRAGGNDKFRNRGPIGQRYSRLTRMKGLYLWNRSYHLIVFRKVIRVVSCPPALKYQVYKTSDASISTLHVPQNGTANERTCPIWLYTMEGEQRVSSKNTKLSTWKREIGAFFREQ